jgi:hypothetical protein
MEIGREMANELTGPSFLSRGFDRSLQRSFNGREGFEDLGTPKSGEESPREEARVFQIGI